MMFHPAFRFRRDATVSLPRRGTPMWARGGGVTADLCRRAAAAASSTARGAAAAAAASHASFRRVATAEMPRASASWATSASATARVPSATLRAPPLAASQGAAASAYWAAASSARASTLASTPAGAARADAFARASLVGTPLASRRAYSGGYFNNSYRPPPLRRPPPASPSHDGEQMLWSIIGANTLIFAGWHAFDPRLMHANFAVSEESIYHGRVHTAVTAAFSHYDFGHYASNMIALYYFGRSIAQLMGSRYLLNLYLAGGVAASLTHVAWCRRERNRRRRRRRRTDGTILQSAGRRWALGGSSSSDYLRTPPALGASGAVNAIVLLNAALFPFQTIYLNFFIPMPTALFAAMFLARDLYGAQMGLGGSGTGHAAHLGGAAVGAAAWGAMRFGLFRRGGGFGRRGGFFG